MISDSVEAEMLFSLASLDWRALGSVEGGGARRFGGFDNGIRMGSKMLEVSYLTILRKLEVLGVMTGACDE